MTKHQFKSLQVFRGFAALAVVAHHAALSTEAFVGTMPESVSQLVNLGLFGVDFFFVLSGFIIMYAHMNDDRTLSATNRYVLKRLTRIFPAYLPVGLGMIVIYTAMPSLSAGAARDFSLVSSVLLLPANAPPALSVAWTLVHELMFYGVFLLFFVQGSWLVVGLLVWALVIVLAEHFIVPTGWLSYPLSLLNIEFMFGVGAAWLVQSRVFQDKGPSVALLGGGLVCFVL